MREREVTRKVAERLKSDGILNLTVRYGSEPGPDIEGELPKTGRHLFVEAKGERPGGSEGAKRRVALGEALFQIFCSYDEEVVCAIALPRTEGYEDLLRRMLPALRRLGLHVLLVKDAEIWHLAPNAAGLFPTIPKSITEVLDT